MVKVILSELQIAGNGISNGQVFMDTSYTSGYGNWIHFIHPLIGIGVQD
jgi:hypothetical protein